MAVRAREVAERRPVEQKGLENALVDDRDATPLDTLIVVNVVPHQLDVAELLQRRIEHHAQEIRQHRLTDAAREGLAVVGAPLPAALDAMAEDFVEEDAGGATGENRRAGKRIDERRLPQFGQQVDHRPRVLDQLLLVGQAGG